SGPHVISCLKYAVMRGKGLYLLWDLVLCAASAQPRNQRSRPKFALHCGIFQRGCDDLRHSQRRAIPVPLTMAIWVRPPVIPKSSSLMSASEPSPRSAIPSVLPTISGKSVLSNRSIFATGLMPTADASDCSNVGRVAASSHLPPAMFV